MTIDAKTKIYRGRHVRDFSMGDQATGSDVVYRLVQDYEAKESQAELIAHFFTQVDPATLDALIIGPWAEASGGGPQDYLAALIALRDRLPALKALFVGDMTSEDCEISWIIQADYNPLLAAFPGLESLRIRGTSELVLAPFEHPNLQELAIECGGLPTAIVDAIAASTLPALRRLDLWLGDENYGFDGDLAVYQRLLAAIQPERLRYLGLRNSMIADALATWLATQPWIGRLQTLDLSLGTIGDAGAMALCASPHLGDLERLDLSHHYISAEWQRKLQALPCKVILDEPRVEDDDDRYVAVSE